MCIIDYILIGLIVVALVVIGVTVTHFIRKPSK